MMIKLFSRVVIICTLFLAGVLPAGCNRQKGDEDEGEGETVRSVVPVHVGKVSRGTAVVRRTVTGKTDVLRREHIVAPVAGRVISLRALEFQPVRAGDTIAVIQTRESQAAIEGAAALETISGGAKQKGEAARTLTLAKSLQSEAVLRATISGIISSRSVTEGELVAENAELETIIDPRTVYFIADVPLAEISEIAVGQSCDVRFPGIPEFRVEGKVEAISPQSDLASQTVRARISFTTRQGEWRSVVRADMMGTASIITGLHRNALLVPKSALLRNQETNGYSIVLVTPDTVAVTVPITVGVIEDSTAEILGEGVREGMTVVTEGNYALPDSCKVTIRTGE